MEKLEADERVARHDDFVARTIPSAVRPTWRAEVAVGVLTANLLPCHSGEPSLELHALAAGPIVDLPGAEHLLDGFDRLFLETGPGGGLSCTAGCRRAARVGTLGSLLCQVEVLLGSHSYECAASARPSACLARLFSQKTHELWLVGLTSNGYNSDATMKPIYQKLTDSPDEGFAFKIVRGSGFDCRVHYRRIRADPCAGERRVTGWWVTTWLRFGARTTWYWWGRICLTSIRTMPADESGGPRPRLLLQFTGTASAAAATVAGTRAGAAVAPARELGLHFTGATRDRVGRLMEQMESLQGLPRIIVPIVLDTLPARQMSGTGQSRFRAAAHGGWTGNA